MEPLSAPERAHAAATPEDVSSAVLASLDVGVVVEGRDGRALSCNPSAERILGLSRAQLAGESPVEPGWSTIHEDGWPLPDDDRPGAVALRTGRPCSRMTLGVKKRGGVVTWVAVDAHPLFERGAELPYAAAVSYVDVSDARAAEEARRREGARFRSLIEYSLDVVTILDEQGRQIYESPGVERLLGYPPGEFEGASRLALIHPEDSSGVVSRLASLLGRPGSSMSAEYRIRARDGSWMIVESVATNRLHDPAVMGIVVTTRDLTERRGEQAALRATSSRLANLVQNLRAGVLVEDEDGRIAVVNRDFCEIFGIDAPPNVLIGTDCRAAAKRVGDRLADPQGFAARLREVLDLREPIAGEEIGFADGRTFERDYIPIAVDGSDRGHLWLYRDISERKAVERRMARARDEAIRASRVKSEFLATMSHEIRTPMNGVIGMLELLLDTQLSPDQRQLADVARESANGLLAIIDDVLDLAKIEAEKLEPREVKFEVATVVEGVADLLLPSAQRKGLWITAFVDPRAGAPLRGDAQWLRQVLVNLVGNAVKFTDAGEVSVRADLESRRADSMTLRFSVSDTGPGIPESARERLFEPFAQLDAAVDGRHGGSGLGLAICQRLVRLMGGEVEVASDLGAGATFTFALTFPTAGEARVPVPTRELSVLVAEACGGAARVVGEYLAAWGMAVTRAATLAEGRALLDAPGAAYDVAIVGTSLGTKVAGLAHELRAATGCAELPLVLLKDVAHDVALDGATPPPFAAELTKPVKQGPLFEAIAAAADPAALPPAVGEEPPAPLARPARGARVLVADDNQVNRDLMVRQLEKLGVRADAVRTGADAIQAARGGAYDALLMDCRMPEIDGIEAARTIRALERDGQRTPIVAVSASASSDEIDACLAAGMDACLTKPFSTAQLGEALASVVPEDGDEPVDPAALDRLSDDVGDGDAVRRVATVFLDALGEVAADLAGALERSDFRELGHLAHRLRSSSATFGARRLARLAGELESVAADDGTQDADEVVAAIVAESRLVSERLAAELA